MNSNQLVTQNTVNEEIIEKVILHNDLSPLTPKQKVMYVRHLATSYGLDPNTNPIKIMKFQGKEVPYADKGAAEQLRKNNKVSMESVETKILEGGIYVVTVNASMPDGRKDSSTGVVSIANLKGDALCNAMLKAETKAKRRVTLSICGLGMIDECEVDSIPNAVKVTPTNEPIVEVISNAELDLKNDIELISKSETLDELKEAFNVACDYWRKRKDAEKIKLIIEAKDKRKEELDMMKEFLDSKGDENE